MIWDLSGVWTKLEGMLHGLIVLLPNVGIAIIVFIRAALLQQAHIVRRGGQEAIAEARDREELEARYQAVEQSLERR
jgi:hypothetical protein